MEYSMKKLIIIAKITAKEHSADLVKNELCKLIAPTLQEEGCLEYKLSQDNNNPNILIFYEEWASREHWQVHMGNDNLAECNKAIENYVEDVQVFEMTNLD